MWHDIEKQKVSSIPCDINGHVAFAIHAEHRADLLPKCRDGYLWKKDSRTEWKGYHPVRYRDCAGFKECESYECTYLQNFGERNKLSFDSKGNSKYCGLQGTHNMWCNARKFTAFRSDKEADIFHTGIHKCVYKSRKIRPEEEVRKALHTGVDIPPCNIQSMEIVSLIRGKKSWNEVENAVKRMTSVKRTSNEKIKQKKKIQPSDNLDAVRKFKEYTDRKDNMLIYDVNESEQTVFKTSREKMKIALLMKSVVSGNHFLQEEFCNHKSVKCFVTLTASVYHTLLQKQIILATMQCQHENKKNIELFWRLFNNAYKTVNDTDERFWPVGWCTEMAHSNFSGLMQIYGEDVLERIKGCEFHFKDSINRQVRGLDDNEASIFKSMANELLCSSKSVEKFRRYNEKRYSFL